MNILESTIQNLEDDFNLPGVEFIRVGLNTDQIEKYQLPHVPLKDSDSRFKSHVKRYGEVAVELDALHPETLRGIVIEALQNQFDMEDMFYHVEMEQDERERLAEIKGASVEYVTSLINGGMN